jgi:ribose transport system substrate-binding protein
LTVAGCSEVPQAPEKRIVILTNGSSPFWDAARAGATDAERDLGLKSAGLRMVVDRNDFKVEGQLDKLKQYATTTDVVGVAISVTDAGSRAIADELRALQRAGIKVITIDSDVDRDNARDARFAYLGTDNIVAGRELGQAARSLLPDGGTYATFVGLKGAANAKERIGGFAEGTGETFQQVENLGDLGDPAVARSNVRDAVDRHPKLDMLVGIWSYNAPAIVQEVKRADIRRQVKVLAFDADPPTITGMDQGLVDVMIVQNPYLMGYLGVTLLKALVDDDQAAIAKILPDLAGKNGDLHDTGLKIVVPDSGSPLTEGLFDSNTKFLRLSEFKKWLAEHDLQGS